MQNHVKVYIEHFGYCKDELDSIPCEYPSCGRIATDVHHIDPRSSFGSTRKHEQDDIKNIIGLCRHHHDLAHGPECREVKAILKEVVIKRHEKD